MQNPHRQNVQRPRKEFFFYKKVQLQGLLSDLLDSSADNLAVWLREKSSLWGIKVLPRRITKQNFRQLSGNKLLVYGTRWDTWELIRKAFASAVICTRTGLPLTPGHWAQPFLTQSSYSTLSGADSRQETNSWEKITSVFMCFSIIQVKSQYFQINHWKYNISSYFQYFPQSADNQWKESFLAVISAHPVSQSEFQHLFGCC